MNLNLRSLKVALLATGVLLLAACGVQPGAELPKSENGYLLSVAVNPGETEASVARRYGGEVIVWLGDKAVLKLSNHAAAALRGRGVSLQNATLEPNAELAAPAEVADAAGWSSWAGGWSSWAGGWSSWAGGWSSWAGGTTSVPSLPSDNGRVWEQTRLNQAHRIARNYGAGVKVAVLDTGLDTAHPMVQGRLAPASEWKDFSSNDLNPQESTTTTGKGYGHGTAVAGIIVQVAPRATLLPVRVLDHEGRGTLANVVQGIYHAVNSGAHVLNLSLGSTAPAQTLLDAVRYAAQRGVYVVSSAGNNGRSGGVTYPARYTWWDGVKGFLFGVGSLDAEYDLSDFSNYGGELFVSAPGEQIVTAFPGSRTVRATGTSFAAPLVTGSLALALGETADVAQRSKLFDHLLGGMIRGGVHDKNSLVRFTTQIGVGALDAEGLLRASPGFTPKVSPVASLGTNLGLEEGSLGWTLVNGNGSATVATGNARTGTRAAVLAATGSGTNSSDIYRIVTGLKPNTNYVYSAWVRGSGFPASAKPGIWAWGFDRSLSWKDTYGNSRAAHLEAATTAYTRLSVAFTTGPSDTTVEIGAWNDGGTLYVDDFSLVEAGY